MKKLASGLVVSAFIMSAGISSPVYAAGMSQCEKDARAQHRKNLRKMQNKGVSSAELKKKLDQALEKCKAKGGHSRPAA